jgi:hypothetical protein
LDKSENEVNETNQPANNARSKTNRVDIRRRVRQQTYANVQERPTKERDDETKVDNDAAWETQSNQSNGDAERQKIHTKKEVGRESRNTTNVALDSNSCR